MNTIGMKKTFCIVAVLSVLCAVVFESGKADAKNKWEDVDPEMWTKTPKEINTIRVRHLNQLKGEYESLKKDYLKNIDFEQDLSKLTMDDLLMLRSSIYAVNGLLFTDNNLYSRFIGGAIPWYSDYMCYLLESQIRTNGKGFVRAEKDVKLSAAEKGFVDKIDERIAELRKNGMYVNKNGYVVGDINHVVNKGMVKLNESYMDKLARNNFVIADLDTGHLQMFHLYELNDYAAMPSFVTTDMFLQAFHMYLSYTLKVLEETKFIPALEDLTFSLYKTAFELSKSKNAEIAEIAEYNTVFYAIPYSLLTGKKLKVSAKYQEDYVNEVRLSKEGLASGQISGFLSYGDEDMYNVVMHYDLHKPRGHYTRKPKMEAYFRTMMWLQKAYACREKTRQLKRNIFTANLLNTAKSSKGKPLTELYASVFEPTALLVGEPNNLSTMDIAQFLKKEGINDLSAALSDENVKKVDQMLTGIADRIIIKPKKLMSCPDKINFLPQRYLIDNEVLQEMADTSFNAPRAFPRGLDVFAAFGSASADDVLNNFYKDKENWKKFPTEMGKLQKKFGNFDGWNKSVYNKWIEALLALQKSDKSYPAFMNTKAWDYKNLNASLASWAELKHDFILYAEQPFAAEGGGCDDPVYLPGPDIEVGYVEPNLLFWNKLDELVKSVSATLTKFNLLDAELRSRTGELQKFITFLIDVSKKELAKKPLSNEDYKTIKGIGGALENFTLTVLDPESRTDNWSLVTGADRSIAVVADIYTRNMPPPFNDPANGIQYAATGKANEIYVVVEINGYLYLTRGAVFSYYEFAVPEDEKKISELNKKSTTPRIFDKEWKGRLTDEDWQKTEDDKSKRPPIQEWMKTISTDEKPQPKTIGGWSSDGGPECYDEGC